jgi:hypothetical protein
MLRDFLLGEAFLLLHACGVSGHYASEGPCKGFHTDQAACQRAAENSTAIGKVQIGQSAVIVRQAMGKDPERRDASADSETWGYLTDYMGSVMTEIVFRNGLVAEIKQKSASR